MPSSRPRIPLRRLLPLLALVVPAGVATKLYDGPGRAWVSGSLSGVFYELFWCLVVCVAFPRAHPAVVSSGVFVTTCALEFTQRWDAPFLRAVRRSFIGSSLIGDTFVPSDFLGYALGSLAGWGTLVRLARSGRGRNPRGPT